MTTCYTYKSTEYNWLGDIPSSWRWLYLSQACNEQCVKNTDNIESNILSLSYGHIIRKKNIDFGLSPKDYNTYQIVDYGNIIMRLTDLQNDHSSLRTGLVLEKGIITSAYVCLKTLENSAYLHYFLHSYDAQKYFYGLGGGVRQSIGFKDIRYIKIPLPPRNEQDQIVRYLDWKVSGISRLINTKRRQIELSGEQKQATINEAVMSGGKEIRLGNLGNFRKGYGGSREDDDENGIACIRYGDIYRTGLFSLTKPITRINNQFVDSYARINKGELLFALSGETKEEIGQALVNEIEEDTLTSGDAGIFKTNDKILPHFLTYALRCPNVVMQRASFAKGDIIVHISTSALSRLQISVPSIPEQETIIKHLSKQCNNIDRIIAKINDEITLLHEYRTCLISDVITGKLDVREVVVPEYEVVEDNFGYVGVEKTLEDKDDEDD